MVLRLLWFYWHVENESIIYWQVLVHLLSSGAFWLAVTKRITLGTLGFGGWGEGVVHWGLKSGFGVVHWGLEGGEGVVHWGLEGGGGGGTLGFVGWGGGGTLGFGGWGGGGTLGFGRWGKGWYIGVWRVGGGGGTLGFGRWGRGWYIGVWRVGEGVVHWGLEGEGGGQGWAILLALVPFLCVYSILFLDNSLHVKEYQDKWPPHCFVEVPLYFVLICL